MTRLTRGAARALLALLALGIAACASTEAADYAAISKQTGVALSVEPAPESTRPMAMVFADDSGLYLFGVLPLRTVSVDGCARGLAEVARRLGADGVADITVKYRKAAPLAFGGETFFAFPWVASIQMIGQAWRWEERPMGAPAR